MGMQARLKPADDKRGLNHAEMRDKSSPLGRNDDDEYGFEGAQIVNSNFTAEELEVFQRRKKTQVSAPAEAEKEAEGGPMRFKKKSERVDKSSTGSQKPGSVTSKTKAQHVEGDAEKKSPDVGATKADRLRMMQSLLAEEQPPPAKKKK